MSLVISRQSWHYRLNVFVRRLWGWKAAPNERWSLCPYFHTVLWGSLLSLIAFIPAFIGWLFAKYGRKAYKAGKSGGFFSA